MKAELDLTLAELLDEATALRERAPGLTEAEVRRCKAGIAEARAIRIGADPPLFGTIQVRKRVIAKYQEAIIRTMRHRLPPAAPAPAKAKSRPRTIRRK